MKSSTKTNLNTHSYINSPIIRKKRDKYNKITTSQRDQLLDMVFFQNKKVKKAASQLNLNYSSAKTILFLHRKEKKLGRNSKKIHHERINEESTRCKIKILPQNLIHNHVEIITMQAGKELYKKNVVFHGNNTKRQSAFKEVKIKNDKKNIVLGKEFEEFLNKLLQQIYFENS